MLRKQVETRTAGSKQPGQEAGVEDAGGDGPSQAATRTQVSREE